MIDVICEKNRIIDVPEGKVFQLDKNLFMEARNYSHLHNCTDHTRFPVVDQEGNFVFWLEYCRNRLYSLYSTGSLVDELWDYDLLDDNNRLDITLFEGKDVVMFWQVEEYSYAITNFILQYFPNTRVLYRDENARLFWDSKQVIIIDSTYAAQDYVLNRNVLYIYSHGYHTSGIVPNMFFGLYDSISVMRSLLWINKRRNLGVLNKDKIILLIDCAAGGCGLVDIMKFTCTYVRLALHRNFVPVVKYDTFPNQYLTEEGQNMWETYFKPVSEITVEEAMHSRNVISLQDNRDNLCDISNPFFVNEFGFISRDIKKADAYLLNHIFLNDKTSNDCLQFCPEMIKKKDKFILGVVMRGTDYRPYALKKRGEKGTNQDVTRVLQRTKELYEMYGYQYVFLATEEEEYLMLFKEEFKEKLLVVDQRRVSYVEARDKDRYVSDILQIQGDELFTKQYLAVLYCLSKCDGLITSINCGAYQAARFFRSEPYGIDEVVT